MELGCGEKIYGRLSHLLGPAWLNDPNPVRLTGEGRVEIVFRRFVVDDLTPTFQERYGFVRGIDTLMSIDQTHCDKWGGLPDPLVVFQLVQENAIANVVSWEDWFSKGGSAPNYRLRRTLLDSGQKDFELQLELNREFEAWLKLLMTMGYRKKS